MEQFSYQNYGDIDRLLGCLLRSMRINSGLSQESVSERLNIYIRTLRRYENGQSPIPASVFFHFIPEMQQLLAAHLLECRCPGNCENCNKAAKRVKRSKNVIQNAHFGPKKLR